MEAEEARRRFAGARVARLATVGADGRPHLVPIAFACVGDVVWSAVDDKPKRTRALRRLDNVRANPRVALLADRYDEDWSALWWVRADGMARVVEADDGPAALDALAERYAQYVSAPPPGPVLEIAVERWSGWRAHPALPAATGRLARPGRVASRSPGSSGGPRATVLDLPLQLGELGDALLSCCSFGSSHSPPHGRTSSRAATAVGTVGAGGTDSRGTLGRS